MSAEPPHELSLEAGLAQMRINLQVRRQQRWIASGACLLSLVAVAFAVPLFAEHLDPILKTIITCFLWLAVIYFALAVSVNTALIMEQGRQIDRVDKLLSVLSKGPSSS